MRRILSLTTPVAALAAAVLFAGPADAQQYKPIEFQEFLVNAKELHGNKVQMHAVFNSDVPVFSNSQFGEAYFKGNGIKDTNHYIFSVVFRAQTKEWLYPVMERKGASHSIWKQIQQLKKGEKITLYGRIKNLGDTGLNSFVEGRNKGGGGFADVPSVLRVEKVTQGWVKTMTEYLQDLGGDAELVDETILMLTREGPGALSVLVKVSQSTQYSDTVRANAAKAIGAFKSTGQLGKLEVTIAKAGDSEKIKTAALRAMADIKLEEALKHLRELAGKKDRDEWVAVGAAELLASGHTQVPALQEALGDAWEGLSGDLAGALIAQAETALEKKNWATVETYAGQAIAVDPKSGVAYRLRGEARLAQTAKRPEVVRLADEDFVKALELGEETPVILLHHAKRLLKAGDKQQAAEFAERVLEEDPKNIDALRVRAEAQGKSVDMLDSRLATMNGVAVRVPSKWTDLDAYTSFKHGLLLYVAGGEKPTQDNPRPPSTTLRVYVSDVPSVPEGSRLNTLQELVEGQAKANQQEIEASGKLKRADDVDAYWAVTKGGEGANVAKIVWVVFRMKGKLLRCIYSSDPATIDKQLATIKESAASCEWQGEKG